MQTKHLDALERRLEAALQSLTEEMKKDWQIHPATQALELSLYVSLEKAKAIWSNGGFTGESQDVTIQSNSSAIGKCEALLEIHENMMAIGGLATDD